MNKTSITWVAALALAAGAAHAQSNITVFGVIDLGVRAVKNGDGGWATAMVDGGLAASRLGFRGTEDLGGGMKAFFNLEMGIDPSTGTLQQSTSTPNYGQAAATTGRAFGRASLVGLSAPVLGEVLSPAAWASDCCQCLCPTRSQSLCLRSQHSTIQILPRDWNRLFWT